MALCGKSVREDERYHASYLVQVQHTSACANAGLDLGQPSPSAIVGPIGPTLRRSVRPGFLFEKPPPPGSLSRFASPHQPRYPLRR